MSAALKALKRRRAELCQNRSVWELKVPGVLHFDYTIGCAHRTEQQGCEGCGATLYRADRLAEIAAGIKAIDVEITELTGKPYATAKPKPAKPAQLALF